MDEHDQLARQIAERIDYENRVRNREYFKKIEEYRQQYETDSLTLNDSNGVSLGVYGHHRQLKEQIDKDYEILKAIDHDRQQGYWRQLEEGKYIHPPADIDRAKKMEAAERALKYKIKNFEETGIRMLDYEYKAMEALYGKDIMELVKHKVDQERAEQQKIEAERLDKIHQDKLKAIEADKLNQAVKNENPPLSQQERIDIFNRKEKFDLFEMARQQITLEQRL